MKVAGIIHKSKTDSFWLCEIPMLDLMVQAKRKKEIPEMLKDAIELLANDPTFTINVSVYKNIVLVSSNNIRKLYALILRRQRQRHGLTLADVAKLLKSRSLNEYAQYEQGKHLPSLETFTKLLEVMDPKIQPFISC